MGRSDRGGVFHLPEQCRAGLGCQCGIGVGGEGAIITHPPEVLAHLVLSVTMEAALLIANGTGRAVVEPALLTMLSGLLSST